MDLFELARSLEDARSAADPALDGGARLHTLDFRSCASGMLPGEDHYRCTTHDATFAEAEPDARVPGCETPILDVADSRVAENREFRYHVLAPPGGGRARAAILLFHGLNEKHWDKYLPWAHRLAAGTGRPVVLFPTAFHMDRAPAAWSDRRRMHRASRSRCEAYPDVIASSLSNVAMSTRLEARPQRFFWSGLQTYHDVVQLLDAVAAGAHPHLDPSARFDVFGYSIGGLLAQVLLMADARPALAEARLVLFCGGAVFNRMSPVSRSILDSVTNVALYSYVVEHLESHLRSHPRLRHHLGPEHPEGLAFRAMLDYGVLRREREERFRRLAHRLYAIALERDTVMPPWEVINTVRGAARDIPARAEVLDFPYPYTHEDPFPRVESRRRAVGDAFERMFDAVTDFLAAGAV